MDAVSCPSCDVVLCGRDLREGWCDQCGKKIPSFVLGQAGVNLRPEKKTRAPRPVEFLEPSRGEDQPTGVRSRQRTVVTLRGRNEQVTDSMPSRCLCCGARATRSVEKQFTWVPFWVYFLILAGGLPFAIAVSALRKVMTVRFPVCNTHRYPWLWVKLVGCAALAYLLVLPWFVIYLSVVAEQSLGQGNQVSVALLLGWLVGIPLWSVLLFVVKWRSPHVRKITASTITLGGVSEDFASTMR